MSMLVDSRPPMDQRWRIALGIGVICCVIIFILVVGFKIADLAQQLQHTNLLPFFLFAIGTPLSVALTIFVAIELITHGHRRSVQIRQLESTLLPLLLESASQIPALPGELNEHTQVDKKLLAALDAHARGDTTALNNLVNRMSASEKHAAMMRLIAAKDALSKTDGTISP
jgi:hypothetical protein